MKKRLISMLLSVLMVVSLFAGMSVSAYADDNVVEHTMAKNETVLKICDSIGINYYTCKSAIMKLNGFTSDAVFRKLSVGQVVKLPASDAAAAQIMSTTTSTGGTTISGGTVVSGGTSTGSNANANVAYWLIPYTMQKGETVAGVCNTLGISFGSYQDQIKTINNISSWSKVAAGKTLLLPTASAPVAGTSCYAVVAHYVSKGETAYGICQTYGVSYNANTSLLQSLNPKVSLTNVKYGTTLLVPVPTVVTAGSSGSGTIINNGNSGTNNGSTTNNGSNSNSSAKTYKLSTGTVTNGKITFTVNGKTATSAAAGSTVTINASPNSMCGLKEVKLKYADGSAVPKVTDGTFTMPSCDVVVSATFEKGYYMGPISAHGSVTLYNAQGVITNTAASGATIKVVVKPNTGYTVSRIYIQKNNGTGAIVKDNMKSGDTFEMPDCPVFVRVEYGETTRYALTKDTKNSSSNGSFKLTVNGSEATEAAAGATVEVVCTPASGYTARDTDITVTNNNYGTTIPVTNGKFIMPASSVTVAVKFTTGDPDKYSITANEVFEGTIRAYINGTVVNEAAAGETITVGALIKTGLAGGYKLSSYTVKDSYTERTYNANESFVMPASAVTITPKFEANSFKLTVTGEDDTKGTVTVKRDGTAIKAGDPVSVTNILSVEVVTKPGYKATVKINGTEGTSYTMPYDATGAIVEIIYDVVPYQLTINTNWVGSVQVDAGTKTETINSNSQIMEFYANETIVVKPVDTSKIVYVEADANVTVTNNDTAEVTLTMAGNATITLHVKDAVAAYSIDPPVDGPNNILATLS